METLDSVGFNTEMRAKPIASLSGGWKMKLALARAMLWNADILLLDEPTNHLDVKNVAWLENYLTHLPTVTSIIVSHDSGFLDNVCTGGPSSPRAGSRTALAGLFAQCVGWVNMARCCTHSHGDHVSHDLQRSQAARGPPLVAASLL